MKHLIRNDEKATDNTLCQRRIKMETSVELIFDQGFPKRFKHLFESINYLAFIFLLKFPRRLRPRDVVDLKATRTCRNMATVMM